MYEWSEEQEMVRQAVRDFVEAVPFVELQSVRELTRSPAHKADYTALGHGLFGLRGPQGSQSAAHLGDRLSDRSY